MATDSPDEIVRVPRLLSREASTWIILAITIVVVVGIAAWVAVTQPENRWAVAVGLAVLVVLFVLLVARSTWFEPRSGVLVRRIVWLIKRRISLATARDISLVNNRGGTLLLGVRGEGHRMRTYIPILQIDDGGARCQSPEFLRFVAGQIETFAPQATRTVATPLRKQADFMATGGEPAESPLAPMITRSLVNAAKAGGGAGSGGNLL